MNSGKKSSRKGSRALYYILVVFCATIFVISGLYIAKYFVESSRQGNAYEDLVGMLESLRATAPTNPADQTNPTVPGSNSSQPTTPGETGSTLPEATQPSPTSPATPTESTILPEYQPFYDMNNDMVGWITVPDTKINYPVMQTPNDPDYYLKRNFDKGSSDWGAIYAWAGCDINKPSDNITLFGHHMKDGSMFAGLDKFKNKSFWEKHKTFSFDTLYEHHTYEIIAVFKTSANLNQGFSYHIYVDMDSENQFNEFISQIKSMSFYDTGVSAVYGDKLLCLSTCEYTLSNGRFVVVAKRIS